MSYPCISEDNYTEFSVWVKATSELCVCECICVFRCVCVCVCWNRLLLRRRTTIVATTTTLWIDTAVESTRRAQIASPSHLHVVPMDCKTPCNYIIIIKWRLLYLYCYYRTKYWIWNPIIVCVCKPKPHTVSVS